VRPVSADVCQQKEKDFRATIRGNTGGAAAAQKIQTEEEIRRGHPLVWMVGVYWNWSPFYTQTDQFTKRGSGQTSKNATKWDACCFLQVWSEFIGIAPQDRVVGNPYRDIR